MRIQANRSELRKAITHTSRFWLTASGSKVPGVLVTPGDGSVELSTTDGELVIRSKLNASIEDPRTAMLPKQIKRALATSTGKKITLDFENDTIKIHGKSARLGLREPKSIKTEIPDYPQSHRSNAEICSKIFRRAIRATSSYTQNSLSTQNFGTHSVSIELSGRTISFKSTDGTKIADYTGDLISSNSCDPQQFLLSPRILRHLARLTSGPTVNISYGNSDYVHFDFDGNTTASVRLTNSQFPNMNQVLSLFDNADYQSITFSKRELSNILAQAAVVTTVHQQAVRMLISKDVLTIEIQTPEVGEFCCDIDISSEIENKEAYLDLAMLRQGLNAIWHQGTVELRISDREKPIRLSTENYQFILMQLALGMRQHHSYDGGLAATRNYMLELPGIRKSP